MPVGSSVWGIDIGQCALKALKLRSVGDGKVEAVAFDLIEHPRILSQTDADQDELIRGALEKFASRNEWQGDQFVVGVPGQQTFARFCKMPPVDPKKVKVLDLVRYEAMQQIPFDIEDVVWDYQTFSPPDSPELEVGIFAMRKDLVRKHLGYFSQHGIVPAMVQTVPAALYNFCRFEQAETEERGGAVVVINVGAQNTDLVIVEPHSAWMRNIPLGGNSFTEAIVRAFKLSFAKAESLKRTAASSKYARQIFQAMRPVFVELVAEIQRSIGYYSSSHRDVELRKVLALGNAFRLPGLQKYLENNLTISGGVMRLEKYDRLVPSATINAPLFTENVLTFAAAYGLALQGLGLGHINVSLLPSDLARVVIWKKKRPYFMAAAACLGLAAILPWTRLFLDKQALASGRAQEADRMTAQVIEEATRLKEAYAQVKTDTGQRERSIQQIVELKKKDVGTVPSLLALVYGAIPDPDPRLARVQTPEQLKELVQSGQLPRTQRRQLLIDSVNIEFVPDIVNFEMPAPGTGGGWSGPAQFVSGAGPVGMGGIVSDVARPPTGAAPVSPGRPGGGDGSGGKPGFHVQVSARLLYGQMQAEAVNFMTNEVYQRLRELANQPGTGFYIPEDDPATGQYNITNPLPRRMGGAAAVTPAPGAPAIADPVTNEDMSTDWQVDFSFKVYLGESPKSAAPGGEDEPGK